MQQLMQQQALQMRPTMVIGPGGLPGFYANGAFYAAIPAGMTLAHAPQQNVSNRAGLGQGAGTGVGAQGAHSSAHPYFLAMQQQQQQAAMSMSAAARGAGMHQQQPQVERPQQPSS
jgi:hypothetical protein